MPVQKKTKKIRKLDHPWLTHLLCLFAGFLFALGFAPYQLWPLTIVSMTIFFTLIHGQQNLKTVTLRGFWYGFGIFAHGISWIFVSIYTYGGTPLALAIPMTLGFIGLFTALLTLQIYLYQKFHFAKYPILTFPALWVLFEWTRSWFLTGCPWLFAGYAFIDSPLAGFAPISGVYGLSFAAVFTATAIAYLITSRRSSIQTQPSLFLLQITCVILIWIGGALLKNIEWVEIDTSPASATKTSIVQGNISQDQKWAPHMREPTKLRYKMYSTQELTDSEWQADLVLWPEAAIPLLYHDALNYIDEMDEVFVQHEATLISGILSMDLIDDRYHYRNSIFAVGLGSGFYHKQKLVPFGEVYPFTESLQEFIPFFGQFKSFTPGKKIQQPLYVSGKKIMPYICYEVIYPDFVRHYAKDTDILLTISNDGWFGRSIGPLQHFEMARMRALENGRYMIRGTNTGVTGIIDHKGQVVAQIPQFEETVLRGTAYSAKGSTPFTHFGSRPILTLCWILLLIGLIRIVRRQG